MLLLLYVMPVISILTLHNQNIDFANVKISNRCPYDLRLSCTFMKFLTVECISTAREKKGLGTIGVRHGG